MRTSTLLLTAIVATAAAGDRAPAPAPPCTTATPACTEWVPLAGGPARSMVYRSHALDAPNEDIQRALVMIHGTGRNADHYFTTAMSAAFLAGALGDTLVIAPHIVSSVQGCGDKLEPNEVSYSCGGDSWRLGAKHGVMIVPECGHNDRCIFTTDAVLPLIFPKH